VQCSAVYSVQCSAVLQLNGTQYPDLSDQHGPTGAAEDISYTALYIVLYAIYIVLQCNIYCIAMHCIKLQFTQSCRTVERFVSMKETAAIYLGMCGVGRIARCTPHRFLILIDGE
jgi:hypothetical protein